MKKRFLQWYRRGIFVEEGLHSYLYPMHLMQVRRYFPRVNQRLVACIWLLIKHAFGRMVNSGVAKGLYGYNQKQVCFVLLYCLCKRIRQTNLVKQASWSAITDGYLQLSLKLEYWFVTHCRLSWFHWKPFQIISRLVFFISLVFDFSWEFLSAWYLSSDISYILFPIEVFQRSLNRLRSLMHKHLV